MTDDPNAFVVAVAIIFVSIIGGIIVSAVPDPVGEILKTPVFSNDPITGEAIVIYEKTTVIFDSLEKTQMTMKFIGQFALFLGFPSATVYSLVKSD